MSRKPGTKPQRQPIALAALKRASKQAVELARQTKTPAWVIEDGKLVDVARPQRKPRKKNDDV